MWAGVETGSLGILSEALHSALDFVAAAITFFAVRIAAIPADESHPYGHGKVENLSALVETALLLLTCAWVLWEAIGRLFVNHVEVEFSWWAFAVVFIAIAVDINRSAMLRRVSKKYRSQALEADALHFTTDIWSSAVVLLGLIGVWLAGFAEPGSMLQEMLKKADSVAAIGVAIVILFVAFGLSKRAIHALMDGGDKEKNELILKVLKEKVPWYPVSRLRMREVGDCMYAELDIAVPKDFPVEAAHEVTHQVQKIVEEALPEGLMCELTVHVDPQEVPEGTPPDVLVQHLALRHRIGVHGYLEVNLPTGSLVFMHVEMPSDWTMEAACEKLAEFEAEVKKSIGMERIAFKIEPDKREIRGGKTVQMLTSEEISEIVEAYFGHRPDVTLRSIDIEEVKGAPLVFVRADLEGSYTVQSAYDLSEEIVRELKEKIPCLGKVVPLLEPPRF